MTITIMWCLTFGYFMALAAKSSVIGSLCGLSSFGIAIYLVTRKNSTDKINGWVRIGIGLVIGIVTFMLHVQR